MGRYSSNVAMVGGLLVLLAIGILAVYFTIHDLVARQEGNRADAGGRRIWDALAIAPDLKKVNAGVRRFEGTPVTGIEFGETHAPEEICDSSRIILNSNACP